MKKRFAGLMFGFSAALSICSANSIVYTNIIVPGSLLTVAEARNDAGAIVGFYDDASTTHGFLLANGSYTTLDAPGSDATLAKAINSGGDIAGDLIAGTSNEAFLLKGGVYSVFAYPGADLTTSAGITDADVIVGTYETAGVAHGFMLNAGLFKPIDFPGADGTVIGGINNAGMVVGSDYVNGSFSGFLLTGGNFTPVNFPGADDTFPSAINDNGTIAGYYYDSGGAANGFVFDGTTYTTFNIPGADNSYVKGYDDGGHGTGFYDHGGNPTGFTGMMIPEPHGLGLFAGMWAAVLALAARRNGLQRRSPSNVLAVFAGIVSMSCIASAQVSGLTLISPRDGATVGQGKVLIWASDSNVASPVVIESSLDGVNFDLLPSEDSPDFGPGSYTAAIDMGEFPVGKVYFRARYATDSSGPVAALINLRRPAPSCKVSRQTALKVLFDCSPTRSSNGSTTSYEIDFGDGTTGSSSSPSISHAYTHLGQFPLAFTALDSAGLSDTLYQQLYLVQVPVVGARAPDCGCDSMVISAKAGTNGKLSDGRRSGPNEPPVATPLGADDTYLSFNFEVSAKLKAGSGTGCTEGQSLKRDTTTPGTPPVVASKMACTAGRVALGRCQKNADCDNLVCTGGVFNGQTCNTVLGRANCAIGTGICKGDGTGMCTAFPLGGATRGNDDYAAPIPDDIGTKVHAPPDGSPMWVDFPGGFGKRTHAQQTTDFKYDGDFLTFVNGAAGNCSCHFKIVVDWDGANQMYRADTGITLVSDGETTANCTIDK